MSAFEKCCRETLKWEGGKVDHPKDPGGRTNQGVIQRVYDGWRKRQGLEPRDVYLMEPQERDAIYRAQYWNLVRGDDLSQVSNGVALVVYDFGVNSGPTRSIRYMQRILGVEEDGDIGEATLAKLESSDPISFIRQFQTARREFVRGLSTYATFGKGWENRINGIEKAAVNIATGRMTPPKPQVNTGPQGKASAEKPKTGGLDAGTVITGAGGTAIIVKETINNVKEAADTFTGLMNAAPWLVVGCLVIGGTVFVWWKYRAKIKEALV